MKISVVTVVLNGAATIGDCLESVSAQSHAVEHIVVDGGSTDGTLALLKEYGRHRLEVLSEPGEGIYESMNRGIAAAAGDVVGTLNADDFYSHPDVTGRVADAFGNSEAGACYGDLDYVSRRDGGRVVRRWRSGSFSEAKAYRGWMPPHPTFFLRRELYERYGAYNPSLGTAADYELMLRFLLKHRVPAGYIPEVLVKMRAGGASGASLAARLRANRMDREAWEVNGLRPRPWTIPMKPLRKIGQFVPFLRGDDRP
jgi:glycosyltransferase involved in cell wall biosynthesis